MRVVRLTSRSATLADTAAIPATVWSLRHGGGYGETPNLWDTYLSLRTLTLLGTAPQDPETHRFVDGLQVPRIGFALTPDSRRGNLEVIYGG